MKDNIILSGPNGKAPDTLPTMVIREDSTGARQFSVESAAFENGELSITGPINALMAQRVSTLLRMRAAQKKPVVLYINSPGGEVQAGLAIVDMIRNYPYELHAFCTGLAASMAAVILASAPRGHRHILPHSKTMIHEPLIAGDVGGSASSIERTAASILETKSIINALLAEYTGRTREEIDRATAFDNFLNAEKSVEFGLCDNVATGYEMI